MEINLVSCDLTDGDYIDMEVSSYSIFHCNSMPSPHHHHHQHHREFEFQMSSATTDYKETTTSPADELFYKGKLLPLHLPPRLQMVEKLLDSSSPSYVIGRDTPEETYSTPLATSAPTPIAPGTPYESCNVSPIQSFRISREMDLEEYLDEYSNGMSNFSCENPKKSWSGKIKVIKQTLLGPGLKSSRSYLKSFFGKSGCSHDSCAIAAQSNEKRPVSKPKGSSLSNIDKAANKRIQGNKSDGTSKQKKKTPKDGNNCQHRRSLSASIKRHANKISSSSSSSSSNSSSSSCSNDSNGFNDVQFVKRSTISADMESPIQGAIAYCKKSQCLVQTRNPANDDDDEYCSPSASRVSRIDDQEKLKHLSSG